MDAIPGGERIWFGNTDPATAIGWHERAKYLCRCASSNAPEEGRDDLALVLDFPFEPGKTVCIEPCIAESIRALWSAGIITRGSCCGHNQEWPSVVIEAPGTIGAHERARALGIIRDSGDRRRWTVLSWELVASVAAKDGDA